MKGFLRRHEHLVIITAMFGPVFVACVVYSYFEKAGLFYHAARMIAEF